MGFRWSAPGTAGRALEVDRLARELYQQRSQSPREMTDERWAEVKRRFPLSVRILREDVERMIEDREI